MISENQRSNLQRSNLQRRINENSVITKPHQIPVPVLKRHIERMFFQYGMDGEDPDVERYFIAQLEQLPVTCDLLTANDLKVYKSWSGLLVGWGFFYNKYIDKLKKYGLSYSPPSDWPTRNPEKVVEVPEIYINNVKGENALTKIEV